MDKYSSIGPGIGVGSATDSAIRVLKYDSNGDVYFRTSYGGTFEKLPEPRKPVHVSDGGITPMYKNPLPVKNTKFQHVQQLKAVIPRDYIVSTIICHTHRFTIQVFQ